MKKLHLVGFTTDNDGLILSSRKGAKSGGFVVAMDDELLSSIEEARRRRDGEEPLSNDDGKPDGALLKPADPRRSRPKSALSPREIQARLRAGSTTAEVAAQAGVDEEWVLRFADPILAEQARVVEGAQQLTLVKSRLGPSAEPLATAVQWNLTDRGVRFSDDVFAASWSAYNLHGTRWAVRFSYTSRQRRHTAEWEVDLRQRSLTALNRLAADLGHVEQGRRRPRLDPPDQPDAESAPAASTGRGRGTGRAKKAPSRAAAATRKAAAAKAGAVTNTAAAAETPGAAKAGAEAKTAKAKTAKAKTAKAKTAKGAVAAKGAPTSGARRGAEMDAVKPSPRQAGRRGKKAGEPAGSTAVKRSSAGKRSQRESSPRKTRPSKKPAPDSPAATTGELAPLPGDTYAERPSHLARPPSPMNMANRASALPGRRQGVPYRAGPPAAPERRSSPPPPPPPPPSPPTPSGQAAPTRDTERAQASQSPPPASAPAQGRERRPAATAARSEPGDGRNAPGNPPTGGAAAPFAVPTRAPGPPPVAPRLPLQPAQAVSSGDDERPAVVILSTPERPTTPEAPSGSFEVERPDQEWSRFAGQSRPAVVRVRAERADTPAGPIEEGESRQARGPRRARSD